MSKVEGWALIPLNSTNIENLDGEFPKRVQ
jgi:hypothetical protein